MLAPHDEGPVLAGRYRGRHAEVPVDHLGGADDRRKAVRRRTAAAVAEGGVLVALERVVDFCLHLAPAHEALEAVGGEGSPLRGRGAELLAIGSIEIPRLLGPDEGFQAQLLRRAPAEGGVGPAHPDPVLVRIGQATGTDEILATLLLAFQSAVPVALTPAEADLQRRDLFHAEGRGAGNLAVAQLLQEGWCRTTASSCGIEAETATEILVEPQPKGVA